MQSIFRINASLAWTSEFFRFLGFDCTIDADGKHRKKGLLSAKVTRADLNAVEVPALNKAIR